MDTSSQRVAAAFPRMQERAESPSRAGGRSQVVLWCEHERRRRLDVEGQITGCGAVQEMEEPGLLAWWPSAVAVQAEAANHRELLRSRAVVVSVAGKSRHRARQVWITKASASEPLMTCRKRRVTSKPGMLWSPGMSLAGAC
jgi:hypothetical protein